MAISMAMTPGPAGGGIGTGISRTGVLGAEFLALRILKRAGSIGGDDLARLMADAPFLLRVQG